MTRLRALWPGDLPLGEAFWTYAVGIGLALNLITRLLFLVLLSGTDRSPRCSSATLCRAL